MASSNPRVPSERRDSTRSTSARARFGHAVRFVSRVVRRFFAHHGLLLASAIAFDALLSVVPLLALALVVTSYFVDPAQVKTMIETQLQFLLPGAIEPVLRAYSGIVEQREAAGGMVLLGLVVFGAFAFRTIREAMTIIFESPAPAKPTILVSIVVPLLYVALIGGGIFLGTVLITLLYALPEGGFEVLHIDAQWRTLVTFTGSLFSFVVLVLLFASFYRFVPQRRVPIALSLLGGLLAASLWELVRRILIWYFTHISIVGVVYGSLASVVVLLISFEIAGLVVLLGGQFIAELDRSARAGLPWYEDP